MTTTYPRLRGTQHPHAKLDDDRARDIYAMRPDWWMPGGDNRLRDDDGTWLQSGADEAAERFGVSKVIVHRIWNERAWTHATLGVES